MFATICVLLLGLTSVVQGDAADPVLPCIARLKPDIKRKKPDVEALVTSWSSQTELALGRFYVVDKDTIIVAVKDEEDALKVKDNLLKNTNCYEVEWKHKSFRRYSDPPYDDLKKQLKAEIKQNTRERLKDRIATKMKDLILKKKSTGEL